MTIKISKISIKSYRSCQLTEFEPNKELSALIGPNGSGKTNVLSAIRLLSSLANSNIRNIRTTNEELLTSTSEIKAWYDWQGKAIVYTVKLNLVTNENNQDEILGADESWYMYDITGSRKQIKIPSGFFGSHFSALKTFSSSRLNPEKEFMLEYFKKHGIDERVIEAIETVLEFGQRIKYYSASQFTNPASCPISFEVESDAQRRRGISITGHKGFLYDMYQEYRKKSEKFSEFIDIVGKKGIGLIETIDFSEIQTSSSSYRVMTGGTVNKKEKVNLLVVPSFKISGNILSPSQLSEGTFKTLALIFYLVTDKSSLLMLEEPEVCVHHGLLNSIVELIKMYSREKQIFISTHSDAVLDNLNVNNVFKVKRDNENGTKVTNIAKSMRNIELKVLKDYLQNEGSLGEYWKHGDLENV